MRTLAIDFGMRRIGLALSDAGGQLASPHDVLTVSSPAEAIKRIADVIAREGVQRLVVGLPLNMDGTLGPQARAAITWAKQLADNLAEMEMQLVFVDERLSSFDAEQQLIRRKSLGEKLTRKRKKEQLDAIAAAAFLQAFLDGTLRPIELD